MPARSIVLPALLCAALVSAQTTALLTGRVVDATSQRGLAGAAVEVAVGDSTYAAVTDSSGHFTFGPLSTGIGSVSASAGGYEKSALNDVWLRSGKPEQVELLLDRAVKELSEARVSGLVVLPPKPGTYDLTVEKSLRYAATFFDPARLANAYPGVAATNDQANHFSVRGNNPNANAWMLEGVEIVSPNHTGNAGTPSDRPTFSGGGTTMLSAQMLGNSRLLTGSLPVQYGNALGGVMDMRLRRGANDRARFTAQAGLIGIDLSTEGPFANAKRGSYLINYRYSTLGLLGAMGVALGDELISFQDLAFNVSLPLGRNAWVNVFGMGGVSSNRFDAKDSTEREFDKDERNIDYESRIGAAGASATVPLGAGRGYWRTALAWSESEQERVEKLDPGTNGIIVRGDQALLSERKLSASTTLHLAFGPRFDVQVGASAMERTMHRIGFAYEQETSGWLLRPHAEVRFGITRGLRISAGAAWSVFTFNDASAVQPRIALDQRLGGSGSIILTAGSRAQLPQQQLYSTGTNAAPLNRDLGFTRSNEASLALALPIGASAAQFRAEVYYQQITNLPVADTRVVDDAGIGTYSMVNAWDEATFIALLDSGEARNMGVEVSLARRMLHQWFYQVNASVYDAVYTDANGVERGSRWDGGYIANGVVGREWARQKELGKRTWGLSLRANAMGNQRTTPINEEASRALGTTVHDLSRAYEDQLAPVFRIDVRVYLKREHRNRTGMWALDLLNATNAQNEAFKYFDVRKDEVVTKYQLGLIPNISYRIEF
ncbi:MAG: TonB-dependent receptor [Flavobacteriales bacterium]|nr:MAG: TonB-dependent receptor [Flavobacteriales bacterium]